MSIYVGNLAYEVSSEDLGEVFREYGAVKRVHIPTDRDTGRSRGFGFVEMENEADEQNAIETLDAAQWMGRSLKVNKAKPRENRNSYGGGNNRKNRF
jgi:RNA recognition motif-containing protein